MIISVKKYESFAGKYMPVVTTISLYYLYKYK